VTASPGLIGGRRRTPAASPPRPPVDPRANVRSPNVSAHVALFRLCRVARRVTEVDTTWPGRRVLAYVWPTTRPQRAPAAYFSGSATVPLSGAIPAAFSSPDQAPKCLCAAQPVGTAGL
jgi:hypothetical protein